MEKNKKVDKKLNQDINRTASKERFPESNMAKESVEDAEKVKSNASSQKKEQFPDDFPQGAD